VFPLCIPRQIGHRILKEPLKINLCPVHMFKRWTTGKRGTIIGPKENTNSLKHSSVGHSTKPLTNSARQGLHLQKGYHRIIITNSSLGP